MARNKYPEETIQLILEQAQRLFIEKGFDNTSIQDIIDQLGGLSKGAIYHHFKSKDEIFEAVCEKIGRENTVYYDKIRDDPTKTGMDKLRWMIKSGYMNPTNDAVCAMMKQFLNDPKFFKNQILENFKLIAPFYIQPIVEQGMRDGSIHTQYPKEFAESFITLLNVWLNPVITKVTPEQMRSKIEFFNLMFAHLGTALFDAEDIEQYAELVQQYQRVDLTLY